MAMPSISRKEFLMGAGASLVAMGLSLGGPRKAGAAGQVLVIDSGAEWQAAAKAAFYDDFERETGIKVVYAAGATGSLAQLRAMVRAGRGEWDVINLQWSHLLEAAEDGLLEPLDYTVIKTDGFLPGTTHKYALALDAIGGVMAYNHEKFPAGKAPRTWADFWDVKTFPGRRGIRSRPFVTMEAALVADGVPPEKLYPLDVERALRKLEELKPHILWWNTNAQQATLILDRQVELMLGTNARLLGGIEKGAPFTIVWNQGCLYLEGWGVAKGAPNRGEAMKFLAYTARPKPQAVFAQGLAYGAVNSQAYAFISPERAKVLPTYPDNLKQMIRVDEGWWVKNQKATEQRWVEWQVR